MGLVEEQQEQYCTSLNDSTPSSLSPSNLTQTAGRTESAGRVQPACGGWTVATVTSASTSPSSGAVTRSARSVVGASACSLPWWVRQEGSPSAWEWWVGQARWVLQLQRGEWGNGFGPGLVRHRANVNEEFGWHWHW